MLLCSQAKSFPKEHIMAILAFKPPPVPRPPPSEQAAQGNKKRSPSRWRGWKKGGKKKIVLHSFRRHFLWGNVFLALHGYPLPPHHTDVSIYNLSCTIYAEKKSAFSGGSVLHQTNRWVSNAVGMSLLLMLGKKAELKLSFCCSRQETDSKMLVHKFREVG